MRILNKTRSLVLFHASNLTIHSTQMTKATLSSVAKHKKASSMLVFSLAEASNTHKISGMNSHIASASENSTSRKFSKSDLLPLKKKENMNL